MDSSHLFYRYYDTLFATKDYAGEVAAVYNYYCESYPLLPLKNVLEIGCGTGSHTLELAKESGVHITAVDIDPEMIALAQVKVGLAGKTHVTVTSDIGIARNIDLAVALFNVVNYHCGDEGLREFFADIAAVLRLQGMFIFDCWNGAAALLDPPGSKAYEQQSEGLKVSCHLTSQTDVARKMTIMNYQLELFSQEGKKIESGNYQLAHRLWTPEELKIALRGAGLEVVTICLPFRFEQAATDADWKIMLVCRKIHEL